ncbi:MAG: TRAP transporter substrate-binding protein DctP [Ectothiorhodospiraceae bacterium]|nr:TRAP transporter substrate-binding protein DctP [Ectothiorhodospiraceae bacterium]
MRAPKFQSLLIAAAIALTPLATSAQSVSWRMQSNLAAGEPGYESVRVNFVEALERMSGGRIKIQLHPVGALFPVQEGLEAVGSGIVEVAMLTGGYFAGKLGPIATLESGVPGAERTAMERYAFFYNKGFIDIAREAYDKYGIFYLAPHLSPSWDIISKKPLRGRADFAGLKIRSFGIEAKWYESMGASSVFLSGAEVYTGLSTGVVDAVRWGSPSVMLKISLNEVGKYYIQPSPMPAPNNNFLVNKESWASLPDDLKAMMLEAAKLASLDYLARAAALDAKAVATMKAGGIEFVQIPDAEWSTMEASARTLWKEYAKEDPTLAARAVKLMEEYLAELGR